MLVEDLQQYIFPLFLLLTFALIRFCKLRVSSLALLFPLICWVVSLSSIKGELVGSVSDARLVMTRLTEDPGLEKSRTFFRNYHKLGGNLGFPELAMLEREVSANDVSLKKSIGPDILIRGKFEWLDLELGRGVIEKLAGVEFGGSPVEFSRDGFRDYLADEDLEYVIPIKGRIESGSWLLLQGPSSISLPTKDDHLAYSFLGWLGRAIVTDTVKVETGFHPDKFSSLMRASELFGHWASNVPRSHAGFLLGSSQLINNFSNSLYGEMQVCARPIFAKAASRVSEEENPELFAAIYNNAAIAKILSTDQAHVMRQARAEFWKAARVRDKLGAPARGARVAYANMVELERMGLVPR